MVVSVCLRTEVADDTHIVLGFLIFVALLVSGGLLLIWLALLFAECLPLVTEHLSDLACRAISMSDPAKSEAQKILTEADAGIFLADRLTLVVGEEHVGRETSLGGIGI